MSFTSRPTEEGAVFRLPDDLDHGADEVRLWLDLRHDVEPQPLQRTAQGWELRIARPPVQRLEYLFVLIHRGRSSMITDPANPLRVATAFGDHSVLEFPGYRPPAWTTREPPPLERVDFAVTAPGLLRPLAITVCAPAATGSDELPLLLLHDGPEFDRLAGVTRFSAALIEDGTLPPHRLALLAPGDRNRWYAALPAYARRWSTSSSRPSATASVRADVRCWPGASLGRSPRCTPRHRPRPASAGCSCSPVVLRPAAGRPRGILRRFDAVTAFVRGDRRGADGGADRRSR